ncbi:elongation factor P 5-aminopentanone reductase [Acetanaerobacterium elongatum]|uniref:3-oxoacyl-[acyl-carrier protein] reductase n=1 Tax=Acetanaerobacterium elongatum TaxID=258515 RepID=A0A1G9WHH0_9FIRM|nr:3-oxoacyl-ACP reductase FabG [Acetanaerobacterium elongatum]SDM83505.1 3-oxoacyl-[acyl-carrier protein] reductase [Acetanaerobacterium elongatum]
MPKTALVTGASRGIGAAVAIKLAQEGFCVAVNYLHSEARAQDVVRSIRLNGGQAAAFHADVSDKAQVDAMVGRIKAQFGGIDVLINNAGIAQQKLFTDITAEEFNRMLGVNLCGMFYSAQAVLPHMIHRKAGNIVNISSIWGITGASCEVHYSAAKAGVIGFTKALAKELGPSGIRVNCIAPGVIATEMNGALDEQTIAVLKEETPLGTLGSAEDIAQAAAFLVSDNAGFITGQVLSPNGGFVI